METHPHKRLFAISLRVVDQDYIVSLGLLRCYYTTSTTFGTSTRSSFDETIVKTLGKPFLLPYSYMIQLSLEFVIKFYSKQQGPEVFTRETDFAAMDGSLALYDIDLIKGLLTRKDNQWDSQCFASNDDCEECEGPDEHGIKHFTIRTCWSIKAVKPIPWHKVCARIVRGTKLYWVKDNHQPMPSQITTADPVIIVSVAVRVMFR